MPAITDVSGISIGHWSDLDAWTGCTVVLAPPDGAAGAVYVRGRASGSRELDALAPCHLVGKAHAILLTGGSAYGLGASDGVMSWLRERGRGFSVGDAGVVPIVPSAVVFDLGLGHSDRWPTAPDARLACEHAGPDVAEGTVGAGTGATVGKVRGAAGAMKGGVGTWSVTRGEVVVGALAVVNAFGDVRDERGDVIAGARSDTGAFVDAATLLADGREPAGSFSRPGTNTTLAVVATNATLGRQDLHETARMAADAFVRHITPVGTMYDGDMVFTLTTGEVEPVSSLQIELLAQRALSTAIVRAVTHATGTPEIPGCAD